MNSKMKNNIDYSILKIIQAVMWGTDSPVITSGLYDEMHLHAITPIIAPIMKSITIPSELVERWKKDVLQQIYSFYRYENTQSKIQLSVPFVILKGTSAAQYYPTPQIRTMGDIDIMTRHEDLETACREIEEQGYIKSRESNREVVYVKNNIVIELHRRFASLNDPNQAEYLDELIIDNINPSHILPDLINGLVLLEHISQHLEHGLGLRQIIDWMMFVDKCLPDSRWATFKSMSDKIGLTKLAIISTRMCEDYLGLSKRKWSADADPNLCKQMLEYVLACGNFGNKRTTKSDISENVLAHASTPKMAFQMLQRQGLINWKAARNHPKLRPFAWIYQLFRYTIKGLNRKKAISSFNSELVAAKKRNEMFKALGVKLTAKGIAILKDGKYIKE